MTSSKLLAVAVVAVILVAGAGAFFLLGDRDDSGPAAPAPGDDPVVPAPDDDQGGDEPGTDPEPAGDGWYDYGDDPALSWSYWLGDLDSPGVSDAKTPISAEDMAEVWKVSDSIDSSSTNWKVPGSAICVGDLTYYYRGSDGTINCVVTATGETVARAACPSASVYNMAIAYGDGKIFVPTLDGSRTVMRAFDAGTLEQLFISQPVDGGEVQGAITYHDGTVLFGTYGGDFACFSSEDVDTTRGDETVSPMWVVEGLGWYNATPAFFGGHCVIVEKGYDKGEAVAYCVDASTGAVTDTVAFDLEYCVSGATAYEGRVYIALNAVTDKENASIDVNSGKTLVIRSFPVSGDGEFVESQERSWSSDVVDGGTQSIPVIWNDRLYIGGGGSVLGSNEPFTVIQIGDGGEMSTAYRVDGLKTKGTASITTAYATEDNGFSVYIYLIEYGRVTSGDAATSTVGTADIYVLRDSVGQTGEDIVFTVTPSVEQFAYQSFSISPDGYLLVRNDTTLFCYGVPVEHGAEDVESSIDRIVAMARAGNVNAGDVERAEARYATLDEAGRAEVSNYSELQALYHTATFTIGDTTESVKVPAGTTVDAPNIRIPDGKVLTGWTCDGSAWDSDLPVTSDITLTAVLTDPCTVTFDPAGGTATDPVRVAPGFILGYVPEPGRDGYTFGGWFSGDSEYIPQHSEVSGDLTLTARWLRDCTLSFDSAGGTPADPVEVTYSLPIGELPTTSRSGYTFLGWFIDGAQIDSSTAYAYEADMTAVAVWSANAATTLSCGDLSVTGVFPDDARLTVNPAGNVSGAVREIRAVAGSDAECFMIFVSGDGVDGTSEYVLSLPVGDALDGRTVTVWYYLSGTGVGQSSGAVSGGFLEVTVYGDTGGDGVQMVIGLEPGTEVGDRI